LKAFLSKLTSFFSSIETKKLNKLKSGNIPVHVAITTDGNGRWAERRNLPRIFGHKKGAKVLRETVILCKDLGIGYLTVFSFSTENWQRPKNEVDGLMLLFAEVLERELPGLVENDVKLNLIGNRKGMPEDVLKIFENAEFKTTRCKSLVFNVAFNYGSRQEILEAALNLSDDICKNKLNRNLVDTKIFSNYLYTKCIPDPDLLIRTSGEYRISNFLLWQIAYTELYFTKTLWPDFNKKTFFKAIASYQKRTRRFGGL
jgi:undecaprenyl diphosphate synthase